MAFYSFHRLKMEKVKVGLYFNLIADILTKNFAEMFVTLASTKFMFFIAVVHVLSLLWQLKISIDI